MVKQTLLVLIIGLAASALVLYATRLFVHAYDATKLVVLVVLLPFAILSQWGKSLSDTLFWALFWVAQAGYVLGIYFAIKFIYSKIQKPRPSRNPDE